MSLFGNMISGLKRLESFLPAAILLPAISFGTAQVPEILLWEGEEVPLATLPLEQLELPEDWQPRMISSACWRGYRGTWEIRDDRLHLLRLVECHGGNSLWSTLLPGKEAPLFADWYSGVLRIPRGEMLEYVHMGFASAHEKDIYLVLVDGDLVGRFEVTNDFNSLSYYDRQRAELGKPDSVEGVEIAPDIGLVEGDWLDAMLLRDHLSDSDDAPGTSATLRGFYFPGRLFMPGNGAVPAWEIVGKSADGVSEPGKASAVEAEVTFSTSEGFVFTAFHQLKVGEFIDRRGRVIVEAWGVR